MARRAPLLLLLLLLTRLTWMASSSLADDVVLHEFVPDVDPHEAVLGLSGRDGSPAAIEYEGEVLPAPDLAQSAANLPPMVATAGDGRLGEQPGQRAPSFSPDRMTELEGTLAYYAAFNPAIAPFKRVTALDRVVLGADGVTPVLVVGSARLRRVPVGDGPAPDGRARDRFWGEARLDFSHGREVPLPSVSPESRILSLRSAPKVELTVLRDGADNFYARIAGKPPADPIAISFLTDAPQSYFGAEIPAVPLSELRLPFALPVGVRERGLRAAAELGIGPEVDLRTAVHALTGHFRAFEESAEPPADTGDVYLDLVRAQKGVCRHRAYGFVVTAQALGIAARFVQNEAHSWVEVPLPGVGPMRIDLGGAAHGLQAHGAEDRPVYRAPEPDRLPRPPVYEESYSQLRRNNTSGLRTPDASELEGHWVPPADSLDGASAPQQSAFAGPDARVDGAGSDAALEQRAGAGPVRVPLSIAVDQRSSRVLRGRKLAITGRVTGPDGNGVAGQRVELSLAAPDREERMLLGVTVSAQDGYYKATVGIPPSLSVGEYRLVAIAPGDAQHAPAVAP